MGNQTPPASPSPGGPEKGPAPASAGSGREPARRVLLARRVRRRALRWVLRVRALDRRPRRDPDFIVVGAQKAGSTSLFAYLAAHPDVDQPLVKEINYFDLWPDRGHAWYRRHFPVRNHPGRLTGEASPMYMVHPYAMQRIARDLPRVKIVVILREPVARLLSHYRHSVRLGHEDLDLRRALENEEARVADDLEALRENPFHSAYAFQKFTYLRRSLYSEQVREIQRLFPGRCLFLRLEDLTRTEELQPLCAFLGIGYAADVPFQAHNVNSEVSVPAEDLVADHVLARIREDSELTCQMLRWAPWAR